MSEQTFEQMLEESLKTIHTGDIVEGKVIDVKDDELILNIDYKSDGILPKSEYSNDPTINLKEAVKVGDVMEVKILKVNDGEGQVSLTHKESLPTEAARDWKMHSTIRKFLPQRLHSFFTVVFP